MRLAVDALAVETAQEINIPWPFHICWFGVVFIASDVDKVVGVFSQDLADWMVEIFAGFASMPRLDTTKLRSWPEGTPKTHFLGLSLILYRRRLAKVSVRSTTRLSILFDFTTTSSM